jgi:Transcriptional regulator, AbiEi antitoxin
MGTLTEAAFKWLRDHHGIITIAQLAKCGVPRRVRDQLILSGLLVPVYRGVYRIATQAVTLESRCAALSAFQPEGFVTGPTGGGMRELRRMPKEMTQPAKGSPEKGSRAKPIQIIHYTVPHGGWLDLDGVRLRQSCIIEPTDVQERSDGIRLASPWRLAFDLAADLPADDLASVIEQILANGLCLPVTLAKTAKRLARPARRGSKAFVTALANRVPGGPLESHPEVRVAKALIARGVPIVAQQTWLDLPNGRRARLDMSVPEVRWGVEVDVHPDHFLQQGTEDRRRDRQCHQIGWQVDRATAIELLDFETLIDDLVAGYRARVKEITGRAS